MFFNKSLILSLVLATFTSVAHAGPIVYALTGSNQFGTIDLATGAFHQTGTSYTPPDGGGLAAGPNGTLLSMSFAGKLYSVNSATGATTLIGPTGLGNCTLTTDPCGPNSANVLGAFGGHQYATDFANNLYSVNPVTGHATLIGATGIPGLPFIPLSDNPDGSFNFYDENLFSAGGSLYANFDAATFNPTTQTITPVIADALYRIDPLSGHATFIAPTDIGLSAIVSVGGTVYAFSGATNQIFTLNLANGHTTLVSNLDPAAGLIVGAVVTPEPCSVLLSGIGIAAISVAKLRGRIAQRSRS